MDEFNAENGRQTPPDVDRQRGSFPSPHPISGHATSVRNYGRHDKELALSRHLALPRVVGTDALERALGHPGLLVVDLSDEDTHARHHVPGAVQLDYEDIIGLTPPATGLLPDRERLEEVFAALGLTPDSHVVACDDENNSLAARLLWTLDAVGHRRWSLLDGGTRKWLAEGRRTETGAARPPRSTYAVAGLTNALVDRSYILDHLADPDLVILDARAPEEYSGELLRAERGGHIPGAVNLDWELAIDPMRAPRLKPEPELRAMLEGIGVTPDKEIIVYCQTHHRSSHTYIVLRSLGYPRVRGYAGSWSEWGNDPDTPIEI